MEYDRLVNEVEAAARLRVSPRTLQAWRQEGKGPEFVRFSARCIRYRVSALDRFVRERVEAPEAKD